MKTKRTSSIPMTDRAKTRVRTLASIICCGVLFSFLVASALFTVSSAPSDSKRANPAPSARSLRHDDRSKSLSTKWVSLLSPLPALAPDTLATYEAVSGACTNNLKSSFILGDEVCVKASAELTGRQLSVSGTDGTLATLVDVTTDPQELVYTLPSTTTSVVNGIVVDNRGTWRATVHSTADFSSTATAFFSVADPANAAADLVIFADSTAEGTVAAGDPTGFLVVLRNDGPDSAADVHVTQTVPANMTFDSATAGDGTPFTCTLEAGVVDCVPSGNLPSGAGSSFTLNYDVVSGAPSAIVTTEIDISSTTTDPFPTSNAAIAKVEIRAAGDAPATCAVSCPLNLTVSANTTQSGQPGAVVNFAGGIEPTGECGAVTSTPASGSFFSVSGSPHTVTVSSETGGGSCSFTITVTETAAPTIDCADDQTATTSGSSNEASVTVNTPTATGTNVVVTGVRNDNRSLSDGYPVGTTTITWTARECNNPPDCDDPNARFASCTQDIIVTSPDAPTISCPSNKTFPATDCTGRTLTAAEIGSPTATGSGVVITSRRSDDLHLTGDPYPVGTTTITWSATDDSDRVASCTQTITITSSGADSEPPTLNVPPNVNATTSTCTATLDDELGVATAEDNCGTVSIKREGVPTFSCPTPGNPGRQCESFVFPTGTTIITYTATDEAGNSTTGTQSVTVTESPAVNPTITAPADASYQCASQVPAASPSQATAADNCGPPVVTVSETNNGGAGSSASPLVITRTFTATDGSGNSASDSQTITVIDDTPPTITAPADSSASADASCQAPIPNYAAGSSASDNCDSSVAVTQSPAAGTMVGKGSHTVTVTATDDAGNSSNDQVVFTVNDTTPPTISCPANITVNLPLNSTATSMVVTYTAPTGTDNCAGATTTQTAGLPSGATFPVGTTTNSFTVTDAEGHTASCSFTVTVLYNFTGFFSPINNLPTLNSVNAGRNIPIKFSLSGNKGLNIMALNNPYSVSYNCASNDPGVDILETNSPGDSTLTYSPDTYHYSWKTESSWAGTCRTLVVTLNDGSVHTAKFKFK